jgi:hypothetical protein
VIFPADKFVVPDTFNELFMVVILFNVVKPETFNVPLMVVLLFNVLLEFNEPLIITFFHVVVPDTFKKEKIVVLFDIELNALISYTPELFIILFIIY